MILLAFLASALLELASLVARPVSARCPRGWWLAEGVSRRGEFACYFDPLIDDGDSAPVVHDVRPVIRSRVWCIPAQRPITDGVLVRCARGPSS